MFGRKESSGAIKTAKCFYYDNKINGLAETNLRNGGKTSNLSPDQAPLLNKNGTINSLMTPSIDLRYLLPKFMNF